MNQINEKKYGAYFIYECSEKANIMKHTGKITVDRDQRKHKISP